VAESATIIDKITELLTQGKGTVAKKPDKSFYPADTKQWAEWADKKLAVMLYPNITRSLDESWECFQYADSVESWNLPMRYATRVAGTLAMSMANGKIKKKYGIVDERAELKTELLVWTDALKTNDFLHGKQMTMPDLMVYGVLNAIEGLQTFNVIMTENATLKAWYDRVKQQIPPPLRK
jgi:microsomal prostaglandin-E synthase 2